MPPDFLNSREDAGLIWAAIFLAFLIYKSPRLVGLPFSILWLALKPPLLFLFGGAAVYCAGILAAASELGAWHTSAAKETVYWFIGTGLILAGHATKEQPGPDYARTLLGRAFRIAIFIEFVVNLSVFPLAIELVFVPVVSLFIIVDAWNQGQSQADPRLVRFADRGLVTFGWLVLLSAALQIGLHSGDVFTRETFERLLVVPALTIAFTPFLLLIAWWSRRQIENLRRRFVLN
jgi:hypothetical protein